MDNMYEYCKGTKFKNMDIYEYCKGNKYHKNSYRNHCLNNKIRSINRVGYYPKRLSIYIEKDPISLKSWNSRHEMYYFAFNPMVRFLRSLYQENRMRLKNKNIFKISKALCKLNQKSKRVINIKYLYEPFSYHKGGF